MANKRKRKREQDDWEEEPNVQDLQPDTDVAKVSLRDFMVPQKVQAFISDYEPCNEGDNGYEQFDDARLREVFKAYVCGLGDTLSLYIEDLQTAGFHMRISIATGEPCIFARHRQ